VGYSYFSSFGLKIICPGERFTAPPLPVNVPPLFYSLLPIKEGRGVQRRRP